MNTTANFTNFASLAAFKSVPTVLTQDLPMLSQYIYENTSGEVQKAFVDLFLGTVMESSGDYPVSGLDAQAWLGYERKACKIRENVQFLNFALPIPYCQYKKSVRKARLKVIYSQEAGS